MKPDSEPGIAASAVSLSESTPSMIPSQATTTNSSLHSPSDASPTATHKAVEATADDDAIQAHIERKRIEHEQQRADQRKAFEEQMALLEQQQREEERTLLRQQSIKDSDALAASAPATPPSQAAPTGAGALAGAPSSTAEKAHLYRSMPTSRRHSREIKAENADDLADTVKSMTLETPTSAKPADGFTPAFLFDDELDNEDSAFVKKYNLNRDDDKFPILVQRESLAPAQGAETTESGSRRGSRQWPQLGASDAALAAAAAAVNRKPDMGGDAALLAHKTSPPHNVSGASTPFTAGARTGTLPLPSPSPRLPQGTGQSSPADAARSGTGSRFVNTGGPALKAGPRGDAAFPSFNLGAFNAGAESPSRFGSYSPSKFDADAARGSRPPSGLFDAFNPTAGANTPGSVYPADKYSIGMPPLAGKPVRKAELDVATRLEDLQGEIFALCKDQHGCRFLQKKLEEGSTAHRDMIFAETFPHFAELMTDPFGNYLCQKMLEYCTDEQRNLIVESVAAELVTISLNMHGTRAVQKMIDFLSTSRQIHSIIVALSMNVVTLIKDLNGNHVIQKCLNRLGAEDNQFIYNAVAAHCVEVATHRHGCCVLQRCIDHASETQRVQLVAEITYNALSLVQDAFGNYVVQYVLDLNNPRFTDAVVRQFVGNVCLLSVQKFSSNVMEKCIRVSEPGVRKQLVEELLNRTRLEKLLRDSFANYVVQTSLDYADPVQRMRLVECIRPILPVIRNTPYGKRIQSKLQRDNLDFGPPGVVPYSVMQAAHQQQLHAMAGMGGGAPGPAYYGQRPMPPPPHFEPRAGAPRPPPRATYGYPAYAKPPPFNREYPNY